MLKSNKSVLLLLRLGVDRRLEGQVRSKWKAGSGRIIWSVDLLLEESCASKARATALAKFSV